MTNKKNKASLYQAVADDQLGDAMLKDRKSVV